MFNLDQSTHYWHPVVIDQVSEEGKKEKFEFDAQFPRLTQAEIKDILQPPRATISTSADLREAFETDLAAALKAELRKSAVINLPGGSEVPESLLDAVTLVAAQQACEKYQDRLLAPTTPVTDESVTARVFAGFRKVTLGGVDAPVNDANKARLLAIRGGMAAIVKSWLKSVGIEGAAKN